MLLISMAIACSSDDDGGDPAAGESDATPECAGDCPTIELPHCNDAQTQRLSVPLRHGEPDGPTFSYAYKLFPRQDGQPATTAIVLNGGPGATLLDYAPDDTGPGGAPAFPLGAITTAEFDVVYTDQRGSGCNQLEGGFAPDALTTEEIARDVLAIVADRQLDDYILFGSSYGTVQATRVAFRAGELGLPAARAVVLEGALGRSPAGGFDEYVAGYDAEWQEVKARLEPDVAAQLEADPPPLGASPEVWGGFIQGSLLVGTLPGAPHPLDVALAPLAGGDEAGLAALSDALDAAAETLEEPQPEVGEVILCTELFGGARNASLVGGAIAPSGPDRCDGRGLELTPYDAARFRIEPPIFYFQGSDDPAVPTASARHHYQSQTLTTRALVTVAAAGHGPLSLDLRSLGCSQALWSAIDALDPDGFVAAVDTCGEGVTLEGASP
jgi:pimeloyl-ACP methyl ester carboxylesterase